MKNLILLFLLFSFLSKSQTFYPSDCIAHDTVTHFYMEDAKKLNMRHIYRANLTYKDSGELNQAITNEYLSALIAVYNATNMPARDTVVNIYKMHCYNPGLHNLLLNVDSNMQWVKNFHHDIFPTGQASLDSIMSKHSLHKTYYGSSGLTATVTLIMNSSNGFNAPALGRFLIRVPGIVLWDYDFFYGEGTDIEDTVNSNFHWFRFKYGWGDCSVGCQHHRYWEFRVHNDCTVEYGGTYGDPLPTGIKENEINFENVKVYPNPTEDQVTIELTNLTAPFKVKLFNALGQVVVDQQANTNVLTLNTASLEAGVYIYSIYDGKKSYKKGKLIKL